MQLADFQRIIAETFAERDRARGLPASVAWLCEEVGELAKAARKGTLQEQVEELADVLAWTASIAEQLGVSLSDAAEQRYGNGCPKCASIPCDCPTV